MCYALVHNLSIESSTELTNHDLCVYVFCELACRFHIRAHLRQSQQEEVGGDGDTVLVQGR